MTLEGRIPSPAGGASVIVPFHRGLAELLRVLASLVASAGVEEIIVVPNGSEEDLSALAGVPRVRTLPLPKACGPAIARNRGAATARCSVLVFVDADVVPHTDAVPRMLQHLDDGTVAGVFGAYDRSPAHPGFFSQYRNLAHAFVHERARPEARTFWAGLGAVRADAFRQVGGFDERFTRPSIEDIELGYRLTQAGYRLRLDPRIRGTHLKPWTLRGGIVTDVRDRGVPWTQALLKFGAVANDLNISWSGRAAVALAYATIAALLGSATWSPALVVAFTAFTGFIAVHAPLLRFFVRERGRWFAARVVLAQFVQHLGNGFSLAVGVTLWGLQRAAAIRTRWTLPPDPWIAPR